MTAAPVLKIEKVTIESGEVEVWTLNRPDVLNALNSDLLKAIDEAGKDLQKRLASNPLAVRALVLKGAGTKAFVAGADIAEMKNFGSAEAQKFSRLGQHAFGRLELLPIPTIAAINGFALGGGLELAMGCDVLVATSHSEFGQPEAYLGLLPGFGATARFVDRLGMNKALELLYSGRRIKAPEAMALGLIQKVVDEGTTTGEEAALKMGLEMARDLTLKSGPLALAAIKRVCRTRRTPEFEAVCEAEAKAFGEIFETADKKEGVAAFLEKRKPAFQGR
ncbi:MAG: enoyl-CoA hydratase/isomerase family protein [Bdellovibrionales bacterium]|nr:enoyl-CoA hydratase/isomerase family protein [Bdellovibrionales bacterium]